MEHADLQQQDRLHGETKKAHRAYRDYRDMGINRSLRKLHEIYTAPESPQDCPTKHLTTIENWSSRYQWQDRISEWEQYQYDRRDEDMEKLRHAERQRRGALLDMMYVKIEAMLDKENTDPDTQIKHANSTMRAIKSYMDISMKHYNDLPTERKDLTTKDKPISVTFTTEPVSEDMVRNRLEALGLADLVDEQTE